MLEFKDSPAESETPWSQGVEMICTKAVQQADRDNAADIARAVLTALADRGWLSVS